MYLAWLAQLLLCITAQKIILFPFTIKMKQATLFETRVNPGKRKATASEAPRLL